MYKQNQLVVFLFFSLIISAQEEQGIVNYGYVKSLQLGQKQGKEFNAQLTFDVNRSYFVSEKDSLETDLNKLLNPVYTEANEEKGTLAIIDLSGTGTNRVGNQVYFDRIKDTLWSYIMYMGSVYIKEKKPTISWKFDNETKKIGKYVCHKATATFRGRDYTVWYTTEIPIPYGPWKLNGLPGLVLEAYDSEYKIFFYFKNMEYPLKKEIKIDFIKFDPDEAFSKWHSYNNYLKHANNIIKKNNERKALFNKERNINAVPIKNTIENDRIENERIEIAE
ncbi:GLPGLI family protein [Flavobacterium sp. TP390]|uniref:GLPGLI family protein n=1 Tax=Flavobacterium profundi TaxID=1774945 RepID=A0A6I4IGY7_9FLAO|nr:GLPGLI family protein [Flavobacterium profundi]MVO08888.1 GLPGLI family protein [Flavobacterium profundi]